MKIVKPSVQLINATPDMVAHIVRCGRTCYQSQPSKTDEDREKFVRMLIKAGHESVLEHGVLTFDIVCDRSISHEIVRHRLASYCLTGDTLLGAYSPVKSRPAKKWTIKTLHDWQADVKRKSRLNLIRVKSMNEAGVIVPGTIKSISDSGIAEVYLVTTRSGKTIKATANHRFHTKVGWKRLFDVNVGDFVTVNGLEAGVNKEWIISKYIDEKMTRPEVASLAGVSDSFLGKIIRKFGIKKDLSLRKNRKAGHGVKGMFSSAALEKLSESKKGDKNPSYRGDNVGRSGGYRRAGILYKPDICIGCGCVDKSRLERHHVDRNPKNNTSANVLYLCQTCHKGFHNGANARAVFTEEVTSIVPVGKQPTFDITMQSAYPNFVANGFVVHNSQESTRYCNYSKDKFSSEISVVCPFTAPASDDEQIRQQYQEIMEVYQTVVQATEVGYMKLISLGVAPQLARYVLPHGLKTEIMMTMNVRELRLFLKQRTALKAHPQMRKIACDIYRIVHAQWPVLVEDIQPPDIYI